ncbi:MAG: hypothetical protein ACKV0T_17635 [Planctomycetales bacterium]
MNAGILLNPTPTPRPTTEQPAIPSWSEPPLASERLARLLNDQEREERTDRARIAELERLGRLAQAD